MLACQARDRDYIVHSIRGSTGLICRLLQCGIGAVIDSVGNILAGTCRKIHRTLHRHRLCRLGGIDDTVKGLSLPLGVDDIGAVHHDITQFKAGHIGLRIIPQSRGIFGHFQGKGIQDNILTVRCLIDNIHQMGTGHAVGPDLHVDTGVKFCAGLGHCRIGFCRRCRIIAGEHHLTTVEPVAHATGLALCQHSAVPAGEVHTGIAADQGCNTTGHVQ